MEILSLIMIFALYLFPTIVAWRRDHRNTAAIFVLNLLLGWTFIGWVVSLVWALTYQSDPPKRIVMTMRDREQWLEERARRP